MSSDQTVRALARLPIFKGLNPGQLSEIVRRAEHILYHPGAVIMEENTEGHAAVVVIAGDVVRVSGPELKSRHEPVPPGSLLGETAMLVEAVYGSTIVARNHVRALRINRDDLHAQMLADPTVADQLTQNLTERLTRFAEELRQVDVLLGGPGILEPVALTPAPPKTPELTAPLQ